LVLLVVSARPFHAASDDPGCAWPEAVATHDGASAVTNAGDASSAADHCAICHWTRLLRSPLTGTGLTVAAPAPATALDCAGPRGYVVPTHDHLPARAPPAFLG
jgi:hypothetical protein